MVKNVLNKKLVRDMRQSGMQFLALILLCVLGTFLFAGLDGIAQMTAATNDRYFEENNLAHFWISLESADRQALNKVRAISGVEEACARFSMDMETTLPGEPTLNVTAYDGAMTINVPLIEQGASLEESDVRGCLLQEGFASANGLEVGDEITVRLNGAEYPLTVRGIVYSPEFISVSNGIAANPLEYGYILVNAQAFEQVPLTEIVVRLSEDADEETVRAAIGEALPEAFIIDRSAHRSTAMAQDNVTMFRALTIVFPLAAFVVSALIVMTTLTRMIDNQRTQIGTLRALGFSDGKIQRYYLSYALWPSLIGSVLGAVIGHLTLPPLVWDLLIGQNEYPYRLEPPISAAAWSMVGVSVVMSALICLWTFRRTAKESAADLLRPKPPKSGRRILLERIGPFWRRLSFNQKMVVRNLLRSKMRSMMSCVGLLCCNALIIASMGLQDSVIATAENHYGRTLAYDVRVELTSEAGAAEAYEERLTSEVTECLMEQSVSVSYEGQTRTTLLTIVKDDQQLLHLGEHESLVEFLPDSVALTEKLARLIGVEVGDTVSFQLPGDEDQFSLTVSQIVYNNFSQGAYMTRSTWESLRKGAFTPTAILLRGPTSDTMTRLENMDEVYRIDFTEDQADEALISLEMVSSIFILLMLIALALAFVICYNMGLINFAERTREYATLKVLGYHQKEIRRLILHENTLLTLLALALSIFPGIGLTSIILLVCETDSVRYVSQVANQSVALSCVITYIFSMFIQRLLVHKVRSIVMVEALKSVE